MKLVLNLAYSLKMAKTDPSILKGPVQTVASRLLGIGEATLQKVRENEKISAIFTPGKTRNNPKRVRKSIDQIDRTKIVFFIKERYKAEASPDATALIII